MVMLADIIPVDSNAVDLELPDEFADLTDFLRDWAFADDVERSDRIESASEQELRRILAVVEPRLKAAISYLNGPNEDPSSNRSANLARVVETLFEIRITLCV
jgi:hypothetical protein